MYYTTQHVRYIHILCDIHFVLYITTYAYLKNTIAQTNLSHNFVHLINI